MALCILMESWSLIYVVVNCKNSLTVYFIQSFQLIWKVCIVQFWLHNTCCANILIYPVHNSETFQSGHCENLKKLCL
jgi:hypothetical protein